MEASEKAKELIDKYINIMPCLRIQTGCTITEFAKQNALIAINEILKADLRKSPYDEISPYEYWQEVKTEIEKY